MDTDTRTPGRRPRRRTVVIASAVVVALTLGGGAAWAAERYLVPHVAIANVDEYEAAQAAQAAGTTTADGTTTATATDGTSTTTTDGTGTGTTAVSVQTVTTGSGTDTVTYYVADVTLGTATDLRSAFADDAFGQNITATTSAIAEDNDAIFAINGDYYGFRDTGIVIRNGVVYRDDGAREGLAFYTDGRVEVYDETATTADELVAGGVWNTLSFGPALIEDGAILDGIDDVEVDTNFGNHSIQGEQPRTAVGVIDENHLVFVVVDGRNEGHSAGVTMTGLAEILQSLGATTAYNLDGGGSSTMYYDGEVVNDPNGTQDERGTSDILYIAAEG
ncbi:phosphodiester glycosidase family protein [Herbiconiux sp. VKM Ac-2851]|uniref:phosphodiester glycosidase family protein n=1 Tax=Herbiconiux sp. VKM Ac-2851 TaxID=2739025 RepID=UPI001566BF4D|nr:phosphodiester glycosidase family protein [Herbiconiux sp. VKM Ac-2851]NQX35229.1 phosphodiester glycosidase family protein [Herbiconiux sp. VKM Ac-2851]